MCRYAILHFFMSRLVSCSANVRLLARNGLARNGLARNGLARNSLVNDEVKFVALLLLLLLFVLRGPVEIGWGMPVRPVHRIQGTTVMNKQWYTSVNTGPHV